MGPIPAIQFLYRFPSHIFPYLHKLYQILASRVSKTLSEAREPQFPNQSFRTNCQGSFQTKFVSGLNMEVEVEDVIRKMFRFYDSNSILKSGVYSFSFCPSIHGRKDEGKPEQWAVAQLQKHGFQDLPLSMEVPYRNEKRPELAVGWLKLALFNLTYLDRNLAECWKKLFCSSIVFLLERRERERDRESIRRSDMRMLGRGNLHRIFPESNLTR